jgi:pepF/M3 family oligoendopeptidase
MIQPLPMKWDLEVLYPGGSDSPEFKAMLEQLEQNTGHLAERVAALKPGSPLEDWEQAVGLLQSVFTQLTEAYSFVSCLMAQDQSDKRAVQWNDRVKSIHARYLSISTRFDERLSQIDSVSWESMLQRETLKPVAFHLNERRRTAKEKMSPELESLAGDLAVDGYHGWGELYNTAVSALRFPFRTGETSVDLSAAQAANKLNDPDRDVRTRMFATWEKTWGEYADFCADALNRLAGFRLKLYEHRGWKSVLKEPLDLNRMSETTLQVMWDVIERNKPIFVRYLERKAKLLGLERLSWHDVEAPIGSLSGRISYDQAAEQIIEQFNRFSPEMAEFAKMAFENGWIEAEDRPGKRPGGFCTSFPAKQQTRIFMTYSGTPSNVSTLAHELGHAYHQHVMNDLPGFAQDYAMNVAETASTFAEMIVSDSALKQAADKETKLVLLEDQIQRSVAFFMNIHARFLFETEFYEARRSGLLGADELSAMMEEAQRKAFRGALAEYHPHFWASKLHFYLTDVPFYNFPYTFGYLFSSGLYVRALEDGPAFAGRYVELLRDTGRMTVEELALKHLGVNLQQADFWQSAIDRAVRDVELFLEMTEPDAESSGAD